MRSVEIHTYGCSLNQSASEVAAGLLAEKGFEVGQKGDVVILNTCTVKTPTERKIIKKLEELRKDGRKTIVAGCLPAADPRLADRFPEFSFIGTNIVDVTSAIESVERKERYVNIKQGACDLSGAKVRPNSAREIIAVSQGCRGACTYCLVKKARGDLVSRPGEKIAGDVKTAVSQGAREIWLTSQDMGSYGLDIGTNLPNMLRQVSSLDGDFFVRTGMANPNYVKEFLEELIEAYKSPKIYKFLHVPVQSGDDQILKDMNRFYRAEDFREIITAFRKEIPDLTVSTDVIAGFPTEDEDAFENTLRLVEETRPDVINISRYWARPGTKAAEMKQHHGRVTNQRSRKLAKLFEGIAKENNRRWVGWSGRALVSERGGRGGYCARNHAYKPIIIKSEEDLLGKYVNVRVLSSTRYDLRGEILC